MSEEETMKRTVSIALMLSCLNVSAKADCLTKEEREEAQWVYSRCVSTAYMNFALGEENWKEMKCDRFPQPSGCFPYRLQLEKDKNYCLEAFKVCVTKE
jgi:hypothetical protein